MQICLTLPKNLNTFCDNINTRKTTYTRANLGSESR